MRAMLRLFAIVGISSVITTGVYGALVLMLFPVLQRPNPSWVTQTIVLSILVLTPVVIAAWWMFRKLRLSYPLRTARATAVAFGISTPVALGIAFPLSALVGAYSEKLAGYPVFGLIGAIVGIVVMIALLGFVPCAVALWVTRQTNQSYRPQ